MARKTSEFEPPSDTFVRHRWISQRTTEWVYAADKIMIEHGAVNGTDTFPTRHQARWRAQKLIRLMDELRLHERWELREHTEQVREGWKWTVEYLGGRNGSRSNANPRTA